MPTAKPTPLKRTDTNSSPTKAGWKIAKFAADVGLSRSYIYQLVKAGTLAKRKAGTRTIVVTSPAAYIASLPEGGAP